MPLHNDSVFSVVPLGSAVQTNATTCLHDCVPEGYWILVTTSILVLLFLVLIVVWAASPRQFCACCGQMGQGFGDVWRGAKQVLLEASPGGDHGDGGNGADNEMEDFWEHKPQTERERQLVAKQEEQRRQAEMDHDEEKEK